MLSSKLDVAAMTHRGGRQENQDRFLVDSAHHLLLVADGVGGLKEGGLAAELACQSTHSNLLAGLPLESAVSGSSAAIAKEATFSPRPGESRVPVAPLPPAVPVPTAVPPTLSQQAIWRQMGRGGWRAARHRS